MKSNGINKESAQKIAVDFLKTRNSSGKVDVSTVDMSKEVWVIRGTCPIDLEGHPWAEKFEVIIDTKGKIRSTNFALL